MDMILISDSKLKIMLTQSDMENFALDQSHTELNDSQTRRAFWNILDKAKQATGFDPENKRVYIQMYPSKTGGCELYVTKITSNIIAASPHYRHYSCRFLSQESKIHFDNVNCNKVYCFADVNSLLFACRILRTQHYIGESSVYSNGFSYYLFLSYHIPIDRKTAVDNFSFLSDIAKQIEPHYANLYIGEYCFVICNGNAVEILSEIG